MLLNEEDPDAGLVRQFKTDSVDEVTWRKFVDRIGGWIRCNFPSLHTDIDNLAGDAALSAYQNVHNFRGESRFFRWVKTIAFHKVCRHINKQNNTITVAFEDLREEPAGDDDTEAGLRKIIADEALQTLTEQERNVFILRARDDVPHKEIAQQLGITDTASRTTWTRASEKIGRYIQDNPL